MKTKKEDKKYWTMTRKLGVVTGVVILGAIVITLLNHVTPDPHIMTAPQLIGSYDFDSIHDAGFMF